MRASLWVVFASLFVTAPVAAQELVPGTGGAAAALRVRDGTTTWSVVRDASEPGAVVATRGDGRSFRAHVDAHALVRLAPGVDAAATFASLGVVPVTEVANAIRAWRVVDARGGDGLALAARLAAHTGPGAPLVDAIPDWLLAHERKSIHIPPNDALYSGQWFLQRIAIEDAWHLSTGAASTTVVVIDSGCDILHPDLVGHMDPGLDVIDGDMDPTPPAGEAEGEHGTACAGLVAASTDNTIGIAGTCPECRLRCVRMLGAPGTLIPMSADLMAFQFVLDTNAAVASNSWGFVGHTTVPFMLADLVTMVMTNGRGGLGAIVVFAAGNDDRVLANDEIEALPGIITVGATNNFDEATAYSNRGDALDVVSPTGTTTTDISGAGGADPGDYTTSFSGTSSACPIVAGVMGLLVTAAPTASGADLSNDLISTAIQSPYALPDAMGHDATYGYGLIDPAHALRRAMGIPDPMPDAGVVDSGAGTDAGGTSTDAGTTSDAGTPPPSGGGCCAVAGDRGARGVLVVVLAIVALAARKRRCAGLP